MSFAEDLKKYKKDNGLRFKDLSKKLGVSASILCRWIKGKQYPSDDTANRIYSIITEKKEIKLMTAKPQEKVVIESAKDLLDALKNNETIYDGSLARCYKMVDGYICCYTQKTGTILSFNTSILFGSELYVVRDKKFVVEVGKTYILDSGEKAVIVSPDTAFKLGSSEPITIDRNGNPLNIVREA